VRRQQHGATFSSDFAKEHADLSLQQWVEPVRWFVQDDEVGFVGQRGDQSELLAIA